ncbi:MAG: S41 family peptidase [Bacteroidota bacterium]
MKYFPAFCLLSFLLACTPESQQSSGPAQEKTSPFSAYQFEEDAVFVLVEGEWFQLLKMDVHEASFLVDECKEMYGGKYRKRFAEDLVEFLQGIDIRMPETVNVLLKNEAGDSLSKRLRFTEEKRNQARDYRQANAQEDKADMGKKLTKEEMEADVLALEKILQDKYSYLNLVGIDLEKEINVVRDQLVEGMPTEDFGFLLRALINKFGDGHSDVEGLHPEMRGVLPIRTARLGDQVVCFTKDGLLDAQHPYLQSIAGIPVEDLIETVKRHLLTDASPQYVARKAPRRLNMVGFLLPFHDAYADEVELVLHDGKNGTKSLTMEVLDAKALLQRMREQSEKRVEEKVFSWEKRTDNLGYLRIRKMAKVPEETVRQAMAELADTDGLIIDVRGNGGGKRDLLQQLIPYFIPPEASPIIGNVAALRTDKSQSPTEGFLQNRSLYPISASHLTERDRAAIKAFQQDFQPEWPFDPARFSDWHYLLLRTEAGKDFYDRPVVILTNAACYSATDIFLSSFAQLAQITILGVASGGGSGRVMAHQLPHSKLELVLSSIISFQPNGQTYDRVGVQPDIFVPQQTVDDVIGKTDHQLDRAIDFLLAEKAAS